MQSMLLPRYKVGETAFISLETDLFVGERFVGRLPIGTEVKIRSVSTLHTFRAPHEIRYEVGIQGSSTMCWLDQARLTSRIIDVR